MEKIRFWLIGMLAVLCAGSCVYDYDPVVPGTERVVVIEGDILVGAFTQVRLSTSRGLDGEPDSGLRDVRVWVEGSDGSRYGGNASTSIDTRAADPLLDYRLVVECSRGTYASSWESVLKSAPVDSISYTISGDGQTMTIDVSSASGSDSPYYRWTAQENWEYHAPFQASHYCVLAWNYDREGIQHPRDTVVPFKNGDNIYYCWNSDHVHDVLIASAEGMTENKIIRHPLYSINCYEERALYLYSVELTQESLPETAYRYWETMLKNSGDVGGLFSPEPFEMRGNIYNVADSSEMVVGYISVTVPAVKRVFIDSQDLQFGKMPRGAYDDIPILVDKSGWRSYMRKGYQVYALHTDGSPGTGREGPETYTFDWLPIRCVDCEKWGKGTKQKPSFWPNDHK